MIVYSTTLKFIKTRVLRKKLADKGLECKGCSEKSDFITQVLESQHLPDIEPPKEKEPTVDEKKVKEKDENDIEDMLADLRSKGFGNTQAFTADDLKDLTPEQMQEKVHKIYMYLLLNSIILRIISS